VSTATEAAPSGHKTEGAFDDRKTGLVDAQGCINRVFEEGSKPSLRTFREWQARGMIPFLKIGKLTFFDPEEVRRALNKRCRVQAAE
jgi:hypothetical protein